MKTKCLSLSRIQKFKIQLGRWELPNVKVHTNSDIIKQIFTFCEKVFPRHKYNYPNFMKLCRGKNTACCLNHVVSWPRWFLYRFKCGWIAENSIWQGHTEGVFELKWILLTDKLFQLLLLLRHLIPIDIWNCLKFMLKMSGKYTIYFDIERPWTLKFNQVYTQLFSDYVIRCLILF